MIGGGQVQLTGHQEVVGGRPRGQFALGPHVRDLKISNDSLVLFIRPQFLISPEAQ